MAERLKFPAEGPDVARGLGDRVGPGLDRREEVLVTELALLNRSGELGTGATAEGLDGNTCGLSDRWSGLDRVEGLGE